LPSVSKYSCATFTLPYLDQLRLEIVVFMHGKMYRHWANIETKQLCADIINLCTYTSTKLFCSVKPVHLAATQKNLGMLRFSDGRPSEFRMAYGARGERLRAKLHILCFAGSSNCMRHKKECLSCKKAML